MRFGLRYVSVALALLIMAPAAQADPASGRWLTEADKKGQVAHVDVYTCGNSLCGKIVKVFDAAGQQISHKNVGRKVFWDGAYVGGGKYTARALVPAFNTEYNAKMVLNGNRLKVGGCKGPVCQSQTWTRVK